MKFADIKNKLKEKSFNLLVRGFAKFLAQIFFVKAKCRLFIFRDYPVDASMLDRYDVDLRIISPEEVNLLSERTYYSKKIWDNRWQQGAQLLGAIWNGKIVEYCWFVPEGSYRDIFDGFFIKLNPGECYDFDYRALEGKPSGLGSFRLMKVMLQHIFRLMKNRFPNYENVCYSTVEEHNRASLLFFELHLKAELTGDVMMYKFLFWKWSRQGKKAQNHKDY
jgi:hypothetical protein